MLRDRLLDAAKAFLIEHDCAQLRMAEVAQRVGVSRQTVYNEFGSKERLVQELALREAGQLLVEVVRRLDEHPGDLTAGFEAAIGYILVTASSDPLLKAVLTGSSGADPFLSTCAEPVLAIATERLVDHVNTNWPDSTLDVQQRRTGMEAVVRLIISHLITPLDAPEQSARQIAWLAGQIWRHS